MSSLATPADAAAPTVHAARPDLLNRAEAARYMRVSVRFLATNGFKGPIITRVGRKVYYLREDLDAWLVAQREPQWHDTRTLLANARAHSRRTCTSGAQATT